MSKLFKLKEWLTVPDAAKHLSVLFGEEVSEADVLRLGLDGHLQLSVYFVNQTYARCGKKIPLNEAKKVPGIPLNRDGSTCEPYEVALGLEIKRLHPDGQVEELILQIEDRIIYINGIWDLPMIASERLYIEQQYHWLVDGVEVTDVNLDGFYLKGLNELYCQLQESFDNSAYQPGSNAQLELLDQHIINNNIEKEEAKKLLDKHQEDRNVYLNKRNSHKKEEDFFPSSIPPRDCILVVRTEALREFEQKHVIVSDDRSNLNTKENISKPESPRKTENLLRALAAIAVDAYEYDPRSAKSNTPQKLADLLNDYEIEFDPKTIRNWLKEGADLLPSKRKKY